MSPVKRVLVVGCVLIVVTCLFPPYYAVLVVEGDNRYAFVGWDWLILPPSKDTMYEAIYGRPFSLLQLKLIAKW